MKIKILQSIAGHTEPRYRLADFSFSPGAVVEVPDALAKAWIASKVAIAADRAEKLTMPVEVYTLPAQPDLPAKAESKDDE
jgi:hypothetical protein